MSYSNTRIKGQSLVEVVVAFVLFTLSITAVMYLLFGAQLSLRESTERTHAVLLAEEGIEAARVIAHHDFTALTGGLHGLSLEDGHFVLNGTSDNSGVFTRTLTVVDVSSSTKNVIVGVLWNFSSVRNNLVEVEALFTDRHN